MKRFYLLLFMLSLLKLTNAQMVITGIADGPLTGGTPKVIELYAYEDIADLSIYGVESANNGAAASAPEFVLSGSASAGQFIHIASEAPNFNAFFGFDPTFVNAVANNNGDDVVVLYKNGSIVDMVGEIGVDGTGTPWESLDGWAYRVSDTGPDASFVLANWTFSGVDQLEGGTTNATTKSPFPIGSFTYGEGGGGTPETVAAPTFTPAAGTYTIAQNITLSSTTEGASIFYTTNGDTPTNASTLYAAPVHIAETTTLKAIAIKGELSSAVTTAIYKLEISSQDASLPYIQHFTLDEGNFSIDSKLGDQVWKWGSFDGGCMVMSGYASGDNNNEDWLISPKFDFSNYTNLKLNFREAINYITSYDDLQVMVSTDYDGDAATPSTWTALTVNGRSTGDNWSFVNVEPIDLSAYEGENMVTIAFKYTSTTAGSSTWEISSFSVTGTEAAVQEPSNHASNFTATTGSITTSSIGLAWNNNDGTVKASGFLIKASIGTIVPPVNGTDPAADTNLTDGAGQVKVPHGTGSYIFDNCSPGTTYHFAIYPYAGSGDAIVFKTENAPVTEATTLSVAPDAPTAFTANVVSTSQIDLDWQNNPTNRQVMVAMNPYEAVAGNPEEGTAYELLQNLPGGGQIVYKGEAGHFSHTNLDPSTYYYYKIWAVSPDLKYSTAMEAFAATLAAEPTNAVTGFTIDGSTTSTLSLSWDAASGANMPDGYLLLIDADAGKLKVPADGTDVAGDLDLTDGSGAVKLDYSTSTYTWEELTAATEYHLAIYPYVNSGDMIDFKVENAPIIAGTTLSGLTPPVITPAAGTYADSVQIIITCATPDAVIYYTTDGTVPDINSEQYSSPLSFYTTTTVKAISVLADEISNVVTRVYTITLTPLTAPVITPNGGSFADSVLVTITSNDANATVYYTIDGSEPNASSLPYNAAIVIKENTTVRAIAIKGNSSSTVSTASFVITITPIDVATPVISPASAEFEENIEVTITCATANAVIYFTTDGSLPTINSTLYTGVFQLNETSTVKAIATLKGFFSSVAAVTYTKVAAPVVVKTLAELRAGKTDGTIYHYKGIADVTFVMSFRNQKYIQDETAGILIDDNPGTLGGNYKIGSGITEIFGTLYDYNGLLEYMPTNTATEVANHTMKTTPQVVTINELKSNFEEYESELIKVENVSIGNVTLANGTDYPIVNEAQESMMLRTHFYNVDYIGSSISNTWMNVTGIALWHMNEGKIVPRNNSDIELTTDVTLYRSDLNIYAAGMNIYIDQNNGSNQVVDIYSMDGKKVKSLLVSEVKNVVPMEKIGLYLVHVKSAQNNLKVQKVLIQ
jgi:hypothetical protein